MVLGLAIMIVYLVVNGNSGPTKHPYFATTPYQRDELKYFIETVSYDNGTIVKWDKDVTVQVLDGASRSDSVVVQEMLREVLPAMGEINITLVDSGGNLTIRLMKSITEYKKLWDGEYHEDFPKGFAVGHLNVWKTRIDHAEIVISPSTSERMKRNVLRHELGHALGLWQHAKSFYETPNLMGKINFRDPDAAMKWSDSHYFTRLDLSALKMLYNDSLPNATPFRELVESIDTTNAPGVYIPLPRLVR